MGEPSPWPWDLPLVNLYGDIVLTYMYYDVPFVPTPEVVVRRMLQLARVRPGEVLYDLGSGDGRIVIMAAKEFGAYAYGIEIRKDLYEQSTAKIRDLGLEGRARIINTNFFDADISDADVVTMYLLTSVNERLKPKLEKELRPGTRVVSHDFEVSGWRPVVVEEVYEEWRSHKIYLYKIPGKEVPIPSGKTAPLEDPFTRQVMALVDGNNSIEDIAVKLNTTPREIRNALRKLIDAGLVEGIKTIR
ncbi:putative RNA methylase [Thermoproteus uzoniensis 768-20]|uniref:RNA methylase n=1 Tax=Thermoproteus uzoniensis (strain 768-20) TaxID=999630 RepID=F2L2S9_THEU7|nr:putative RNA methylase [Thermoproteus uzoniensis 768-20]